MSDFKNQESNGAAVKLVDWAVRIIIPLLLAYLLGLTSAVLAMRTDIEVIKGNRFSAIDALQMEANIRKDMPPMPWRTRIEELENCVRRLEQGRSCD